jgi:hypothetical protein
MESQYLHIRRASNTSDDRSLLLRLLQIQHCRHFSSDRNWADPPSLWLELGASIAPPPQLSNRCQQRAPPPAVLYP